MEDQVKVKKTKFGFIHKGRFATIVYTSHKKNTKKEQVKKKRAKQRKERNRRRRRRNQR